MSFVFGSEEEKELQEEVRVGRVCLYPAWRREQLGAFLSQPPPRLIRGRMRSRGARRLPGLRGEGGGESLNVSLVRSTPGWTRVSVCECVCERVCSLLEAAPGRSHAGKLLPAGWSQLSAQEKAPLCPVTLLLLGLTSPVPGRQPGKSYRTVCEGLRRIPWQQKRKPSPVGGGREGGGGIHPLPKVGLEVLSGRAGCRFTMEMVLRWSIGSFSEGFWQLFSILGQKTFILHKRAINPNATHSSSFPHNWGLITK